MTLSPVKKLIVNHFIKSFSFSFEFQVKKDGFFHGGGGTRTVQFQNGQGDLMQLKSSGKTLTVSIGPGLPKASRKIYVIIFLWLCIIMVQKKIKAIVCMVTKFYPT